MELYMSKLKAMKAVISFTKQMITKGITAIEHGETAEVSKKAFFKSIEGRVPASNISESKGAFENVAIAYLDKQWKLNGALVTEWSKPKAERPKGAVKIGKKTFRFYAKQASTIKGRWMTNYRRFLKTGESDGRKVSKAKSKRATGGATKPNNPSTDSVSLNDANVERSVLSHLMSKELIDGLETQFQRDVAFTFHRLAFYKSKADPVTDNERIMKSAFLKVIDNASASCLKAADLRNKLKDADNKRNKG